ncbi:MAG: hypothetical protein ACRDT1_05535, partial [Micromonosporaceae bacterium]
MKQTRPPEPDGAAAMADAAAPGTVGAAADGSGDGAAAGGAARTVAGSSAAPYDPARARRRLGVWLSVPTVVLLLLLFVLPLGIFVGYAFLRGGYYQVTGDVTIANFTDALGDSLVRDLTQRALATGLMTALICLIAGVPLAYVIRFRSGRMENALLLLVVLEMFASYLVRIYAWRTVLGA